MATGQITWEQFITVNNDARGVRYKFEDLCRQLFTYEFLSKNKIHKYVHSNPNNPGIESEPILNEETDKYIGYQAKFFANEVGYSQIKESAKKAVKHYKGKLDVIYLFCNKSVTTTRDSFKEIENLLNDAGIEIQLITDTTILDLVRKYPSLGKYYFDDHGISHEWFVNETARVVDVLGERFNADFNVDTVAARNLAIFLQNQDAVDYFNNKKRKFVDEILQLKWKQEYPWSSGSKSIEELQWENIKVETGEMKSIIETVEEPQFSYAEILQKKYLGEFDEDKKWDELGTALDEKISIPVVCKKYTREEPMTVGLGRVLNSCQDLIWEEEFDASKEETISVSHPCAEIIKVLGLSQKKYDGYYCNKAGELIAFDTALTKQKAGLIIRKDALDEFLSIKNFHLVWFVNASKEIHDESLMIKKYTDWTGLLEYKGDFVEGEYYITEYR